MDPFTSERGRLAALAAVALTALVIAQAGAAAVRTGEPPFVGPSASRLWYSAILDVGRFAVLALVALWTTRRFPLTGRPLKNLSLGFSLVLLATLLAHLVFTYGFFCKGQWFSGCPGTGTQLLFLSTSLPIPLAIAAGGYGIQIYRRMAEHEERRLRLATDLTRAQLEMLTMQVHPHFLFNALNSAAVLVDDEPAAAERFLEQLQQLLHASLRADSYLVLLSEELDIVRAYVGVEKVRYGSRLRVRLEVPDELMGVRVPHLMLQPLVENAIRHGISRRTGPGEIVVSARRGDDRLELRVTDDGVGLPDGWSWSDAGVGLTNTRARLQRIYGNEHEFRLLNRPGGGLTVVLRTPLRSGATAPLPGR